MRKREVLIEQIAKKGLCAICKGSKMLCGKAECPLLLRYYALMRMHKKLGKDIHGSSPPGVFVGRYGYPKVAIGPLVPPLIGNTEYMDIPENWIDMGIRDFVEMRSTLVRGMKRYSVTNAHDPDYFVVSLQEMAMSEAHVDTETTFERTPRGTLVPGSEVQPYGPKAPIKKFSVDSIRVNRKLEKFYYDEAKTTEAVLSLYRDGVRVSLIQKALSMGIFGERKKFVPTRWSITAVDSLLSKVLVEKIKDFPTIDNSMVFVSDKMENTFAVIFLPRKWSYELVEAWYPGTLWNPYGSKTFMVSSHEFYEGRKDYAEIGGCYYAARLAVTEKLIKMRRQAEVIVLREAKPTYLMPLGVWHVRENVRNAMKNEPRIFESEKEAIRYAISQFRIPFERWVDGSTLLKRFYTQRRIEDYEVL